MSRICDKQPWLVRPPAVISDAPAPIYVSEMVMAWGSQMDVQLWQLLQSELLLTVARLPSIL